MNNHTQKMRDSAHAPTSLEDDIGSEDEAREDGNDDPPTFPAAATRKKI
jgi:hypothetical protein